MRGQAKTGLLVVLGLLVVVGAYAVATYNKLVRLHEQIPAAWSQVENVLQRRNDLIPNLVETVKGYAKHEQKVFGDIAQALQSFNRATTIPDKIAASDSISGLLSRILNIPTSRPMKISTGSRMSWPERKTALPSSVYGSTKRCRPITAW